MRLLTLLATMVVCTGHTLAQTASWENWPASPPVTTTITMTLLHVNASQTTTMTSYSSTATGSEQIANVTSSVYSKPASASLTPVSSTASSTTAAIATFSSGAAVVQEANMAIVAIAGVGAMAYGLF